MKHPIFWAMPFVLCACGLVEGTPASTSGSVLSASSMGMGSLDQQQESSGTVWSVVDAAHTEGESFGVSRAGIVSAISLQLGGSVKMDVNVALFSVDPSGFPTGAPLGETTIASASIPNNNIEAWVNGRWVTGAFTSPVSVRPGSRYAFVVTGAIPAAGLYLAGINSKVYQGGEAFERLISSSGSGGAVAGDASTRSEPVPAWSLMPGGDFAFKIYLR
ncbi:MAG: hypothetical protein KGR26_11790 [Cyanobacteria bacterium REEB65]|nr:hypothetical protein [Cyanobacteria bacterium REEB65]